MAIQKQNDCKLYINPNLVRHIAETPEGMTEILLLTKEIHLVTDDVEVIRKELGWVPPDVT